MLVRELVELREMLVGMTRTVTGQGLEEEGGKTGDRVVGLVDQENDCWHQTTAWQKKTGMEGQQRATFRQRIETPLYRLKESMGQKGRKLVGS